jgi:hypothetical protein
VSRPAPELLADLADATRLTAEQSVASARAAVREVAWAQRAEATGVACGRSRVAGPRGLDVLVVDLDAHVLVCHSEKGTSGRSTSSPPTASAGYLGRKTGRGFRDCS